jgi:hypothetical protein
MAGLEGHIERSNDIVEEVMALERGVLETQVG